MLEIINGGLFVAAAIGITTLAIKYPKTYAGVQKFLIAALFAGVTLYFTFSFGFMFGTLQYSEFVASDRYSEFSKKREQEAPPILKVGLAAFGCVFYLLLLSALSNAITNETKQSPKDKVDVEQEQNAESPDKEIK